MVIFSADRVQIFHEIFRQLLEPTRYTTQRKINPVVWILDRSDYWQLNIDKSLSDQLA
jgi:hypothetical protein